MADEDRDLLMEDFGRLLSSCRTRLGLAPASITRRMRKAEKDMVRLRKQGYSPKRIGELLNFDPIEVRMVLRPLGLSN
jgi:DNA-binding Lrp family transcriptional regulator